MNTKLGFLDQIVKYIVKVSFFDIFASINSYLALDLTNRSGQSSLGLTHVGLDKKRGCIKWVVQLMTLTRSFKSWIKTGLIRIFTREKKKNIYIYIYIYIYLYI
jgi:hypothetical protein